MDLFFWMVTKKSSSWNSLYYPFRKCGPFVYLVTLFFCWALKKHNLQNSYLYIYFLLYFLSFRHLTVGWSLQMFSWPSTITDMTIICFCTLQKCFRQNICPLLTFYRHGNDNSFQCWRSVCSSTRVIILIN